MIYFSIPSPCRFTHLSQHVIRQCMPSAQNCGFCEQNPSKTASFTSVSQLASVATKMLLQRADKMKVTWYPGPTQPNRQQPCCSNLDGSVLNICHTALPLHQVIFIFLVLWRSMLVVRFQNVVEVQEALSHCFHQQRPEFWAEGIHSAITHYDKCKDLHGDCEKVGQSSLFTWKMLSWTNSY